MTVKAHTEDSNVTQMCCNTTHTVDLQQQCHCIPHTKVVRQSEGAASQGKQSAQYGEQLIVWNTGGQ